MGKDDDVSSYEKDHSRKKVVCPICGKTKTTRGSMFFRCCGKGHKIADNLAKDSGMIDTDEGKNGNTNKNVDFSNSNIEDKNNSQKLDLSKKDLFGGAGKNMSNKTVNAKGSKSNNQDSWNCGVCGTELDKKYKFCPSCGAELDWSGI